MLTLPVLLLLSFNHNLITVKWRGMVIVDIMEGDLRLEGLLTDIVIMVDLDLIEVDIIEDIN